MELMIGSAPFFNDVNEFQHIFRGVFAVEQAIRDAVVPVHRDGNQPRVDVLPAFDGEQDFTCLGAAVEHRHIVELGGVFDAYHRMIFFPCHCGENRSRRSHPAAPSSVFRRKDR